MHLVEICLQCTSYNSRRNAFTDMERKWLHLFLLFLFDNMRQNSFYKKQVRMYYGSLTGGRCCICARQMLRVHSPGGSIFLCEMTSCPPCWKCDIKTKIWPHQMGRWVFIWGIILPNFTQIRFKTMEGAFIGVFEEVAVALMTWRTRFE